MQEKNIHADVLIYSHHHLKRFLLHLSKDWEFECAHVHSVPCLQIHTSKKIPQPQSNTETKHRLFIKVLFKKTPKLQEICSPCSGFCCILTFSSTKSKEFGLAATGQILTHQTSTKPEPWASCLYSRSFQKKDREINHHWKFLSFWWLNSESPKFKSHLNSIR